MRGIEKGNSGRSRANLFCKTESHRLFSFPSAFSFWPASTETHDLFAMQFWSVVVVHTANATPAKRWCLPRCALGCWHVWKHRHDIVFISILLWHLLLVCGAWGSNDCGRKLLLGRRFYWCGQKLMKMSFIGIKPCVHCSQEACVLHCILGNNKQWNCA